jgi:hypothetical protein
MNRLEKFDAKVIKIMQDVPISEITKTFSQVGDRYHPHKFTANRCLDRSKLGKRHPAFLE